MYHFLSNSWWCLWIIHNKTVLDFWVCNLTKYECIKYGALLTRYNFLNSSRNQHLTYFMNILFCSCRCFVQDDIVHIIFFTYKCVFKSFVSFCTRCPSVPDVSFPHHRLLNVNLLRLFQCTRVSALVSEHACASVCLCSRSHPRCSVARLIGGILVSPENECVCVWWLRMCYVGCRFLYVCLFCGCLSGADPTTCHPSVKSLNAGLENHLYLCVLPGCFHCCGSHYVFCILQHHALVSYLTWWCNDPCHNQSVPKYSVCNSFFFTLDKEFVLWDFGDVFTES